MELEVLLEPGAVKRPGSLDVDPAKAVVLDYLDVGLSRSRNEGIDPGPATCAAQPWLWQIRHGV
jgi:hypothetical protein